MSRGALVVAVLLSGVVLSGCTGPGNLLDEPGFEADTEAWFWFEGHEDWGPFRYDDNVSYAGSRSLHTPVDVDANGPPTLVVGAIQEIDADQTDGEVPRRLGVTWRADAWQSSVAKTYVQVVVSVFPRDGATRPLCPGLQPSHPCQLAYILAGVEDPPLSIANRLYVFAGPREAPLHQWVTHDWDLADHFQRTWGTTPEDFDHLWVYLEARYDASEGQPAGPVQLDVHWDEVYLGN